MSQSITQGKTYIPYLDAAYAQASLTAVLDAGENLVRLGANGKDLLIATTAMGGLGNYTRGSDYPAGEVTFGWETVTPGYDRGRMFKIDAMDDLETAGLAFGTLAGEFIRTKTVPELDAYRFAAYASTANISTVNGATLSNAAETIAAIRTARTTMEEDGVQLANCFLFITPTLLGYINDADTTTSRDVLSEFAGVVKVPQSRFYTGVTLASGANAADAGGYSKTADTGKDINFMIIDKTALIQAAKHTAPKIVTPEMNQDGDSWKFGYRIYGVAHVMTQKVDGIYLHKKA